MNGLERFRFAQANKRKTREWKEEQRLTIAVARMWDAWTDLEEERSENDRTDANVWWAFNRMVRPSGGRKARAE